jgi:hypothetical protein
MRIKIITIWQPWASLLVENKKHIETRSWATSYRGPIGIHAAKKCPLDGLFIMCKETRTLVFKALGFLGDTVNWQQEFPSGVILGYANLTDCKLITEEFAELIKTMTPNEYAFGDFTPGRYAWVMDNPIKLKHPLQAKGMQRLWEHEVPEEEEQSLKWC